MLVSVRDPVALADAIELLVRDVALREKMGRASRALAVREFGIEPVVSDTFRVYGEGVVLSGGKVLSRTFFVKSALSPSHTTR